MLSFSGRTMRKSWKSGEKEMERVAKPDRPVLCRNCYTPMIQESKGYRCERCGLEVNLVKEGVSRVIKEYGDVLRKLGE